MSTESWGIDGQVSAACELADRVLRLPATPVGDWSGRAARSLSLLVDRCPIVAGLCWLGEDGEPALIEDAGVSLQNGKMSRAARALLNGSGDHWKLAADTPEGVCVNRRVSELEPRTAGLWDAVGAETVTFASEPLDGKLPQRRLVTGYGLGPDRMGVDGEARARVLGAVMPKLVARCRSAFGTKRSLKPSERLTEKEAEVLDHLLDGKSVGVIAELMERSPHTVHDHTKKLHKKLGATSRGELVAKALGHVLRK